MNTVLRTTQNSEFALLRSFSSADEPFSESVSNTISICGLQVVWELFEKKFGGGFDEETRALARLLKEWVTNDLTFRDAWSVPAGQMKSSLRSSCENEAKEALIGFALHLAVNRRSLSWTGSIAGITRLFCNQQPVPEGETLRIDASDGHVEVFVDEIRVINQKIKILDHKEPPFWSMDAYLAAQKFKDVSPDISTAPRDDIDGALFNALELLARLPAFEQWVLRLTNAFIPLRIRDDTHLSRSFAHRPGLICASCPSNPTMLAELLVHEATHQYFYMLNSFNPIEDGSDKAGYFSPVKGCNRPIFNILLAYHAFGNILLFHRALLESEVGCEKAFSTKRVQQIEGYIPQFEEALATSSALTDAGNALWQPLAKRCTNAEF